MPNINHEHANTDCYRHRQRHKRECRPAANQVGPGPKPAHQDVLHSHIPKPGFECVLREPVADQDHKHRPQKENRWDRPVGPVEKLSSMRRTLILPHRPCKDLVRLHPVQIADIGVVLVMIVLHRKIGVRSHRPRKHPHKVIHFARPEIAAMPTVVLDAKHPHRAAHEGNDGDGSERDIAPSVTAQTDRACVAE